MLIVMKPHASEEDVRRVCEKIASIGFRAHPMPGAQRTAVGITGNPGRWSRKSSRACRGSPKPSGFPSPSSW